MNIKITQIQNCTGCHACMSSCPHAAIAMREDKEGFLYPNIDENKCVACKLCEPICPILHPGEPMQPLAVYAAKNNNFEERLKSASGGMFPLLAKKIIEDEGIVFGACFEPCWNVKHTYIQKVDKIALLSGSKYLQSIIGENYGKVEQFLKAGKKVLFSGTPCQIAGLKRFLQKEYHNLCTVDLVCHGVPSPKVWQQYLKEVVNQTDIKTIDFRDKRNGWRAFNVTASGKSGELFSEHHSKNSYMYGFLQNLYLRLSCYQCPVKQFKSGSDITIGDFWGIQNFYPDFNDDKGVSVVFINTQKGLDLFKELDVTCIETDYKKAVSANIMVEESVKPHPKRQLFFHLFNKKEKTVTQLVEKLLHKSFITKVKAKLKRILKIY